MVEYKLNPLQFDLALKNIKAEVAPVLISRIKRKGMLQAYQNVDSRTPVEKGFLRAANEITDVGVAPDHISFNPGSDKTGSRAGRKASAVIAKLQAFSKSILSNPLVYAPVVEFGLYGRGGRGRYLVTAAGYSKKAPNGMYRLAFQDLVTGIQRIAAREIAKLNLGPDGKPIGGTNG